MKTKIIIFLLILNSTFTWSQNEVVQVIVDPVSESKKILIDSLMVATRFEEHFNDYCYLRNLYAGMKKGQTFKESQNNMVKIDYIGFKENYIYNEYSMFADEEIRSAIEFISKQKNSSINSVFILTTSTLEYNLHVYVESALLREEEK